MTHPIPSETIEHYVNALRATNATILTALNDIILWAERHGLTKADLITGGQAEVPVITNARAAIALAKETGLPTPPRTITVQLEGCLVQDVNGIPAGCQVRVEDYDHSDDTQPTWDKEKGCHVTVYAEDHASDFPAQAPRFNAAELADVLALSSDILQLAEIDADDGDLALRALSKIRALARVAEATFKGAAS